MGFLDPPLAYVWGEPIKASNRQAGPFHARGASQVRQQKPVDDKYLDEASLLRIRMLLCWLRPKLPAVGHIRS